MTPWQFRTPDAPLAPQADETALLLECGSGYHMGYFTAEMPVPDGAHAASFRVGVEMDGGAHPYAAAVWRDASEKNIQHDYFTPGAPYALRMNLPADAASLEIQLGAYFTGEGRARFVSPEFPFCAQIPPRRAVLATAQIRHGGGPNNLAEVLRAVEQAAALPDKPDLLLFCETALFCRCGISLADSAMAVDHPFVEAIRQAARAAGMYVVLPIIELDGAMRYNTALLID
ncbi:MAG TPA: nitrilase-related carbon-nitrogen hydrolase, partial [Clostridia bacterium]|nr:nitrilase-related carbon-nitrogen hydrolase [Clostridia bacterium]